MEEQFLVITSNDNGLSIIGPMTREKVEVYLKDAIEMKDVIYQEFPEMMGGQFVDDGIVVLKVEVMKPKPVQMVTKFEF
jgi:hypothetical protein